MAVLPPYPPPTCVWWFPRHIPPFPCKVTHFFLPSLHISHSFYYLCPQKPNHMKQKSHIIIPEGLHEVLLHACCAPCSSAIVEWMLQHDIRPTIFYYNPNIYPQQEYEIRKNESKRHADSLNIPWLDGDYDHQTWLAQIRGLEHEPERGSRCLQCFRIRLTATALQAQQLGIPYFATTLASSRWKSLDQITQAGLAAQQAVASTPAEGGFPAPSPSVPHAEGGFPASFPSVPHAQSGFPAFSPLFWAQNWRKDGLQDRRNQLLQSYSFYNQQYCGCEFSIRPSLP